MWVRDIGRKMITRTKREARQGAFSWFGGGGESSVVPNLVLLAQITIFTTKLPELISSE